DGDVGGGGEDVEERGALLRLGHDRPDLVRRRVGADRVGDLHAAEPAADIRVGAEDAVQSVLRLDSGVYGAQLDLAVLGARGDAGGQAPTEGHQDEFHRC